MLPRTLFVGKGNGSVAWYRCALPAIALGQDWIAGTGEPDALRIGAGNAAGIDFRDLSRYDVVVLQQPCGSAWVRRIRALQASGIVVLYEIDDYIQAIRKMDHDFADRFDKNTAREYELAMGVCDGLIVSTEYLARRYRAFNKNVHVCRNGLDLKRYEVTRPAREQVNIGWAGGTGHKEALEAWLPAITDVLAARPTTGFFTVGQRFNFTLRHEVAIERLVSLPFLDLNAYPSAMANFDIAIAPAGKGNFFKAKSDLRWLEASAMRLPLVADPEVYPEIEHGVTGFHAASPAEARELLLALVDDPALRDRVGAAAQAHVREHRTIQVAAQRWADVLGLVARPDVAEAV